MNKSILSDEASQDPANRHEAMVARFERFSQQHGRVLFQGQWLTPGQVKKRYRWLRFRSWWVLFEVMALLVILSLGVISMWMLLSYMVGVG